MRITHRFLSFRWFVGLLTHLFRLRVWSPLAISRLTANALLQPSLRAMTALPMTGFHRAQISLHGKQYFRITATFGILPRACNLKCADCCSCDGFLPCPGFTPDSLVQRTRMRVRLLGSRICHKSHAIQFIICAPNFTHTKRPLLPCYLAGKRSLVFSVYSVCLYAKTTFLFK